jgi:electron transfer flavoprotein alpha subunit
MSVASPRSWAVLWDTAPAPEAPASTTPVDAAAATIRVAAACAAARGGAVEVVLVRRREHGAAVPAWLEAAIGSARVSCVRSVEHQLLERGTPGATATVLGVAVHSVGGVHTVCLRHDYDAVDLCGLLATTLGATAVTSVLEVRAGEDGLHIVRPAHGGRLLAELRVGRNEPLLLTVPRGASLLATTPDVAVEDARRSLRIEPLELDPRLACGLPDRELLGIDEPTAPASLMAAERIVAVGRGLGGPEHLPLARRLAAALDAEVAGSRPVIDAGWLPPERQVGSSGQTVAPALYLALGISGAAQHLEGMSGARCVVAINRDPEAPLLRSARYAIVGDLHEVVPELLAALAEE